MRNVRRWFVLGLVVWLGLGLGLGLGLDPRPASAQEPAPAAPPLRWRFEKGEPPLLYRYASKQTSEMTFAGAPAGSEPARSRVDLRLDYRLSVQETDPATGVAQILCRYEEVALAGEQVLLGKFAFDSATEDARLVDDPRLKPYAALVGLEFVFLLAPDGRVPEVRGLDKVRQAMLLGSEDNPVAVHDVRTHFGDAAVRAQLERSFHVVPDDPAAASGARWARTVEAPVALLGGVRHETAYVLAERDAGGMARIAFETKLAKGETPPDPTVPQHGLVELALVGGGGSGEILFDAAAGRIARSSQRVEMEVKARLEMPEGREPGQATSRVRMESSLELLRSAK